MRKDTNRLLLVVGGGGMATDHSLLKVWGWGKRRPSSIPSLKHCAFYIKPTHRCIIMYWHDLLCQHKINWALQRLLIKKIKLALTVIKFSRSMMWHISEGQATCQQSIQTYIGYLFLRLRPVLSSNIQRMVHYVHLWSLFYNKGSVVKVDDIY